MVDFIYLLESKHLLRGKEDVAVLSVRKVVQILSS